MGSCHKCDPIVLSHWELTPMKPYSERFYNSDPWHACRTAYLQSRDYLCERCSTPSNPIIAKIVHHKTELTPENIHDPHVTLSWDNLEALCQDCHNREHHCNTTVARYTFDEEGNLLPV